MAAYLGVQFRSARGQDARPRLLQRRNLFHGSYRIGRLVFISSESIRVVDIHEIRKLRMYENCGETLHEFPFDQIADPDYVVLKTNGSINCTQLESLLLQPQL